MASVFPTSLDNFPNPSPTDLVENVNPDLDHNTQHANVNDAIENIEAYVGVTGSAVPTSLTNRIAALEASSSGNQAPTLNYLYWNYDPQPNSSNNFVSGRLYVNRLSIPKSGTITNVHCELATVPAALTGAYGALYTAAGTLLAQSASIHSGIGAGYKVFPLSAPQVVAAGQYYVAFWMVFASTAPTYGANTGSAATRVNGATVAPNLRFATADSGLTTTAPASMGSQTASVSMWCAVS